MFFKFTKNHDISNFAPGELVVKWTKEIEGVEYGSYYYEVTNKLVSGKAYSYIPSALRDKFDIYYMKINHSIPPHIDNGIITVLNFYIRSSGCVTSFYTASSVIPDEKLTGHTDGGIFNKDKLTLHSQFTARMNEVYALDVSKIHSVDGQEPVNRIAVTLQSSSVSLDELVAALNS